ncbi:MAG: FAD-dependent oxidoreductase [Pseudomonadota bacterium]
MRTVVCGGGVIGAATAYQLARRGVDVILVERARVGGAASGKSGGFLAQDWCDGTPLQQLARRSFDLHAEWAEDLGNPYGYRRVDTFAAALGIGVASVSATPKIATWLAPDVLHRQRLGNLETTAQLDPRVFTETLADAAVAHGATVRHAAVTGLRRDDASGAAAGIVLDDGSEIACDAVIFAIGPWTALAAAWLNLPPVYGLKGHSIVFRPKGALPAEAIFAEVEEADGRALTPEIVPRTDGTVYVCGSRGTDPLPVDPSQVVPEHGHCERLIEATKRLVPSLADADVIAEQACYRPITSDGLPLIGHIPGADGAYVATGHSVWGMLNAPGTGEALADMITDGATRHVDIAPFAPERLSPLDPNDVELRGRIS